tara:strand:+ start:1094 stop:1342 length:249 start_codon:yes stop_codon:yes gene_type:complete
MHWDSLGIMLENPWNWLRLSAIVFAGLPGGEETIMKKTNLYVRLVREVALTALVLIKLGQAVYALVGPALNYRRCLNEKLHQ